MSQPGAQESPYGSPAARVEELRNLGVELYPPGYRRTHTAQRLQELYAELGSGSDTEDVVRLAGRIMVVRNSFIFVDLVDSTGQIQLYCPRGSEQHSRFRALHLQRGDLIGVEGTIRRTPRGELSVCVSSFELLSPCLQVLPGAWDGFTDAEGRLRQRHLDMLMNPGVRETMRRRTLTVRYLREYLDSRGFLEFETPVLQVEAGGAHARPFVTHHNALDTDMYLRIATELHLKRLIVGGFEQVYEIGKLFRNEGLSTRHNPEFTSLELYQAYGDYVQLMDFVEHLLADVAERVTGSPQVGYQGVVIDFGARIRRVTMDDAIREVTGIDTAAIATLEEARTAATAAAVVLDGEDSRGAVINTIFEQRVEETLIQPTFVTDYPLEVSPLARAHRSRPGYTERFELFVFGRELANGYSELVDPIDQRERLEAQARSRDGGDQEAQPLSLEYIRALECGMPPTMGVGIGIDRLVMLLTDSASIREVIAFPTLRPQRQERRE